MTARQMAFDTVTPKHRIVQTSSETKLTLNPAREVRWLDHLDAMCSRA